MVRKVSNIAASVHQRLLNRAKSSSRLFSELLQYFAIERFIYRLSRTRQADKFILKGALMLPVWSGAASRPTMDIDFLARTANDPTVIADAIRDACILDVEPDGMFFDPGSVTAAKITEDAIYEGVRVRVRGSLGPARVSLQVDVGFGDIIVPGPILVSYPALLDFPPAQLAGYTRESTIAEKLQAMVKLGVLNSRMKDFYDIWMLSRTSDFGGHTLAEAVEKTFGNRKTAIPATPEAFQPMFAVDPDRRTQWRAFTTKSRTADAPEAFADVVAAIKAFLQPLLAALADGRPFKSVWKAPGPWR